MMLRLATATGVFLLVGVAVAAATLPPGGSFTDDDGNIHEPAIEAIAAEGITKGCNPPINDLYCPADTVTRGQMAAFLVRALDLPATGDAPFLDATGVFEDPINRLAAAGITKGCNPPDNTLFCPSGGVTRGQMAAFLVRALNLPATSEAPFSDAAGVFEDSINRLAAEGITKGCNPPDNTLYCPAAAVTRAQMATFLTRALGLTPIVPPPPTSSTSSTTSSTTTSSTTSTTLSPGDGCAMVEIRDLNWDAPGNDVTNPNGEWVELENNGAAATDMTGCKLHDEGTNHEYAFAGFSLGASDKVKLFSGCGTDTATDLYWCTGAVWNNDGDTATLRDTDNSIVDTFSY